MEVCLNDTWGTVCDDAWNNVDASVACRQLGYSRFSEHIICTHECHYVPSKLIRLNNYSYNVLPSDATAYSNAHFGQGTGPILLDDVACVGNESRLVDCQYTSVHNCAHIEDAGASCKAECKCVIHALSDTSWMKLKLLHCLSMVLLYIHLDTSCLDWSLLDR